MNIAGPDNPAESRGTACVNDDRAGDEGDAAVLLLDLFKHLGNFSDGGFSPALGWNIIGHEGEAETVALFEFRLNAYAVRSADDHFTFFDIPQFAAFCLAII